MKNNVNTIPGTNPDWKKELPDGYNNSLVDKAGRNWDNGYNFDERDDEQGTDETTFDSLANEVKFDPEAAKKTREAKKQ